MHRIRAESQGEHDGHVRGAQGDALLPFRAIEMRPGSVLPWVQDAGWMRGWDLGRSRIVIATRTSWSFAPGATGMLKRTSFRYARLNRSSVPSAPITPLGRPRLHVQADLQSAVESAPLSRSPPLGRI
jgi:hypothetical protein